MPFVDSSVSVKYQLIIFSIYGASIKLNRRQLTYLPPHYGQVTDTICKLYSEILRPKTTNMLSLRISPYLLEY